MSEHQVVIVGAGPVGLAAACLLGQYGVEVALVEKLPEPVVRTKAAGIWSRSLEMLAQMNLDQKFVERGLKSYRANIFVSGEKVAHLTLDRIPSVYNYVLMLPQHKTEQLLSERLKELKIPLYRSWELCKLEQSEENVMLQATSGASLKAKYVLGCDGAHSQVRRLLDLSFEGAERPNQWLVADVKMRGLTWQDEVLAYVTEDKPLAVFPLGDHCYRIVGETEEIGPDEEPRPIEEVAREMLSDRIPETLTFEKFLDISYFRIHERQVKQYRKGRVFLAGDAAHVHSPLGGQGMNTGLQDAHNLAWKLAGVCRGLLGEAALESYHEERHPVAAGVLRQTGFGTSMLTLRSSLARHLRDRVISLASSLAPLQNKARNTLSELDINYASSSLSREPETRVSAWMFGKGIAAGHRAPDGVAKLGSGEETSLFEFFKDHRFTLLLFGSHHESGWDSFEALIKAARRFEELLTPLWIGADLKAPPKREGEPYLLDVTGALHNQYAATIPCYYLVRPDGYIATRHLSTEFRVLLDYFRVLTNRDS